MEYRILGKTGIRVSRLCFGALTIGPLQVNMSPAAGGEVIAYALARGINFIDTAQLYKTYPHIREGMKRSGIRPVIATKSYCYTEDLAQEALEEALDELEVGYVDIFLLHEQESELTLAGHREALSYLIKQKEKGRIRAVGLSTHAVRGAMAGALSPEIEVIHPMINMRGMGIIDGGQEEMLRAIRLAHERGKGVYAMKVLGGGHLISDAYAAFQWANDLPCLDSLALGMQSKTEVDVNLAWIDKRRVPELEAQLRAVKRHLLIEDWCEGCGKCVEKCPQNALYIDLKDRTAKVREESCVLCGYCGAVCPQFCIKIV